MPTSRKLLPGQKGTKRLSGQYGKQLVCVRYRYDRQQRKRFTTVELIVAEAAWSPPPDRIAGDTIVGVRVGFKEADLQRKVKLAGGRWNPAKRVWDLRYDQVVALDLRDRVEREVSDSRHLPVSTIRH